MKDLLDGINAWYAVLVVVAGGLVTFAVTARAQWAKSKTNVVMEAAQQSGIASMVQALASSGAREKEAWALVTSIRDERDSTLREMGTVKEEVASLRMQHADCEQRLHEFQQSLNLFEAKQEDERRMFRNRMEDASTKNRKLFNENRKLGGASTATDLIGPNE